MNENNKLFSKLVDKMTSGKKPAFRGQENTYKTSVFADNSEGRPNKMEPNSVKPEGGVFRQLFNQVNAAEPRMEKRSSSKQKTMDTVSESEGLSCIVYKMKAHPKGETRDLKAKLMENSKAKLMENSKAKLMENSKAKEPITANIPAILLKRKQSRPDSVVEEAKQLQSQKKHQKVDES